MRHAVEHVPPTSKIYNKDAFWAIASLKRLGDAAKSDRKLPIMYCDRCEPDDLHFGAAAQVFVSVIVDDIFTKFCLKGMEGQKATFKIFVADVLEQLTTYGDNDYIKSSPRGFAGRRRQRLTSS